MGAADQFQPNTAAADKGNLGANMAGVNLQKSYSTLNEKLIKLFDESGVRRSFTVPYVDGQDMNVHVESVGQAATQSGGLTNNLIMTAHHSGGKGWGSGEGHTVGHPADKLRNTVIPKDDEHAKAAIDAAQTHLNNVAKLIGDDDPAVKTAKSQLDLVKKTEGAGMTLLDFGVMLQQLTYAPNQAVARAHSGAKEGGHSPQLRAPGAAAPQEEQEEPAGGEQPQGGEASAPAAAGGQPEAQAAPSAAPEAPAAAPEASAAPAAPQAQG